CITIFAAALPSFVALLAVHSFPTRRSSDLPPAVVKDLKGKNTSGVSGEPQPSLLGWLREPETRLGTRQQLPPVILNGAPRGSRLDRKSTRLNSSHVSNSYAVFCLKKTSRSI